jgi:hypothetical protein
MSTVTMSSVSNESWCLLLELSMSTNGVLQPYVDVVVEVFEVHMDRSCALVHEQELAADLAAYLSKCTARCVTFEGPARHILVMAHVDRGFLETHIIDGVAEILRWMSDLQSHDSESF